MNPDLFPETLLVDVVNGYTFTTSRKVAEHFHKLHKNVMQSIGIMECSPEFSRLNFQPSTYTSKRKKSYPMYHITRDGFAFLSMGFTGKEAAFWKESFLAAFNQMETELKARVTREAAALHQLRPLLAPVVAGTEQGLRRLAIGSTIGRSANSVSYHRRTARRLGLLPLALKPNPEQLAA